MNTTLTPRQAQIIDMRLQGLYYKEIARKLGIGTANVGNDVSAAYDKLGVCNMRQLRALKRGKEAVS
jgi:DNA-binding CsgD family transcriptional regulator